VNHWDFLGIFLGLQSPRLQGVKCLDLADLDLVENHLDSIFPIGQFGRNFLVNNAGSIGEIKRVGQLNPKRFQALFNLKICYAPAIVDECLSRDRIMFNSIKIVCNIAPGAAHKPLEGCSGYCSSKAGLAMFTACLQKENEKKTEFGFLAWLPGSLIRQCKN